MGRGGLEVVEGGTKAMRKHSSRWALSEAGTYALAQTQGGFCY